MATSEFAKFAGILSGALSQHHLLGFEIAQLKFKLNLASCILLLSLVAPRQVTKSRTRLSNFTLTFHFHALEKEMATHSSVLAWRIPGTGEPGGLLSMGSHRVGHD